MVRYNIVLIPGQNKEQFIDYAQTLSNAVLVDRYLIGGEASIPHVSLCHFESTPAQVEIIWGQIQALGCPGLPLKFEHRRSKAYLGSRRDAGLIWVSLMPDQSDALYALHLKVAAIVVKPLNQSYENYDPHMTLFNSRKEMVCEVFNQHPRVIPALADYFILALGLVDGCGQVTKVLHIA